MDPPSDSNGAAFRHVAAAAAAAAAATGTETPNLEVCEGNVRRKLSLYMCGYLCNVYVFITYGVFATLSSQVDVIM
jgi:hypothetical protein